MLRHNKAIRKGRVIADDKRWMIRGVDREIRKAIKDAAKSRRDQRRDMGAPRPAANARSDREWSGHRAGFERTGCGVLEARLSVLEKSHRALHQSVQATDRPTTNGASEQRWRRTKKSK